jgi:hypothetical protein
VFGGCGDDKATTTACATDAECAFGLVCDGGQCGQVACGSVADCLNGNQDCVTVNGGQFCAVVECGCTNCGACPLGEVCQEGVCAAPVSCSDAAPCSGTDVCDNGTCRPCTGAECGATDCTATGCALGSTCNPTSKQCEPLTAPTANPCDTCSAASDCGDGWKCAPILTGNACLPPCGSNNDCETGWSCVSGACTPDSYRCEGCVTAGCPDGKACNPSNNTCVDAAGVCGGCGKDWECGEDQACRNGECVKRCGASGCPDGGACTTTSGGVEVCQTSCEAECTPACSGATPICNNGQCVQCRVAGDCAQGQQCDQATGLCTGSAQCSGATPILWQGRCVECTNDSHCNGEFCNQNTNQCESSQCAACAAPYPACVQIGEDSYCVQCATDEDCGVGGTCNTQSYACQGGTVTPTEKCTQDSDCDPGASGLPLVCDEPSGVCYSTDGTCDNVTAFCVGTDGKVEKCVSILEIFGGAAGGMSLPPEFSGGGTLPGFCGCTPNPATLGLTSNCQAGTCIDFGALLGLIGGGGSQPGAAPNNVCFPLGF